MSLIDSDSRLKHLLQRLEGRPDVPKPHTLKDIMAFALNILQNIPRATPRTAQLIAARQWLSDSRSKLVERKLILMEEEVLIAGALNDTDVYLKEKFSNLLGSIKNQQAREIMVQKSLLPVVQRLRRIKSTRDRLEEIIKDLDTRAFAIRDMIAALQYGERES